ncbi:YciI family protein [Sulfitobacter sp.]|jgi:uncharacterized protein|uniref:YciI family protein n=1 Tax=Sulfitobacter sp. TaxID=1903071 RepID=UPI000C0D7B80|nr:hypothetical protein [Roseobacter sp.]MBV49265.1 hypothetical protein [Roseobacter sp.]PHR00248.1 MAG: hypothetical protein COB29_16000 [Sulfitobacter sp.]|tara:strand:- start:20 stop:292 length:273 start_codon:yes stop_codon:yes gene_type:complete
MLIALLATDKPDSISVRKENRAAHLEYLKSTGCVSQAGPLLDDDGQMIGSLIILDVEDKSAAQEWANNDPYAKAALFENVQLMIWKRVIG